MSNNSQRRLYFFLLLIFFFSLGLSIDNFNQPIPTMASSETIRWGLSFKEENSLPDPNLPASELLKYNAFFYDANNSKTLYLSFDAGFENGNTQAILDTLEKHGVTAIFFLVSDYIRQSPEMVKSMIDGGHIIGNHTDSHPNMNEKTKADFTSEILKMEQCFEENIGFELEDKFYRPPQGRFTTENLQWANEMGYTTLLWSAAYVDWEIDNQPSHEEALTTLYSRVHDGAIFLLHPQSSTNAEILDEFISTLLKEGYEFGNPKNIS